MVRLLDDLLASCSNPGRFAGAVAEGTALEMIEEQSHDTTPQRRRVAVASVALRGLAAADDAARAMVDADEQNQSADVDGLIAAPTPAASPTSSPTAVPRPSVTALAPPSTMPTIHDQTFALLGDAVVGDADHEDLIAAVEAAREWTAPEDAVAALAIGTSPAQAITTSGSPP